LQPVLTKIVQGKLPSKYHKMFVLGTRLQREKLKVMRKFGPIQHWRSDKKRTKLVKYLEQVAREASNDNFQFTYATDVLLPEVS